MAVISRDQIKNWVMDVAEGEFHYKDIMGLRTVMTPELDTNLRKVMFDFCHQAVPICEGLGRGYYKRIDELEKPVDWQETDATKDFPVILPFDLRKYAWIDTGTHIIIAGAKDSGKTGFMLRTVAMNMNTVNTVFLCNMEGGKSQLKRRFGAMDIEIPSPPPFQTWMKEIDFHHWMKERDTLYVIDYIDVPDSGEFFMVAPALARIQRKCVELDSVAVIGLQKPVNRDTAFGGDQTLKKASLYVAMNYGTLKIISAKVHADPKINPRNMKWDFTYENEGTKFTNITPAWVV